MTRLIRVDYRLLHGQVAISWTKTIGADCILLCNDAVAGDEMRQSMFRLSKPAGVKLVIKSVEDSIAAINSGVTDKYSLFVVVNNVQDARSLAEGCRAVKAVNLGVLPPKEGTVALSKAINVTPEDKQDLLAMLAAGVALEIRQVPTETQIKVTPEMLK